MTETKIIPVIDFIDTSCNGQKIITAQGIDGILYAFEVMSRKPIPMIMPLSRRNVTDFREYNGTDEEVPVPRHILHLWNRK